MKKLGLIILLLLTACLQDAALSPLAVDDGAAETVITIDGGNDQIIDYADFTLLGERVRNGSAPFTFTVDETKLEPGRYTVYVRVSINMLGRSSVNKRSVTFDVERRTVPTSEPTPTEPGRELLFSDEFNGTSLDTSVWAHCFPWTNPDGCHNRSNRSQAVYLPDNVTVSNGTLKLTAKRQAVSVSGTNWQYTSGMVSSHKGFTHTYGYIEACMKIPAGQGFWPAFWNLPLPVSWPPEIDVMEAVNNDYRSEMHYHYNDSSGVYRQSGAVDSGTNICGSWHTYAVEWTPRTLSGIWTAWNGTAFR